MLHGCIPVVTNAAALPEIVGSAGVVIDNYNPRQIAKRIRWILNNYNDNSEVVMRAREFSIEHRAKTLIPLIQKLAESKKVRL